MHGCGGEGKCGEGYFPCLFLNRDGVGGREVQSVERFVGTCLLLHVTMYRWIALLHMLL